jgi:hypothetical protein
MRVGHLPRVKPGQVEVGGFARTKDESPDGERLEGPAGEDLRGEGLSTAQTVDAVGGISQPRLPVSSSEPDHSGSTTSIADAEDNAGEGDR